ncbi:MAG: helix-turn-helix domain-containing protein, partial [Solirubrobacteraceae bacterium]
MAGIEHAPSPSGQLGHRIRGARERKGLSLRKLAEELGISPSALSQIETGRSRPSVNTLYTIVSALGVSMDALFLRDGEDAGAAGGRAANGRADWRVVRKAARKAIDLDSGVRWERLNETGDHDVDFLFVTYEADGSSSASGKLQRHAGREYGLVVSGRLKVAIGFDEYELEPGDAISFASTDPHRLASLDGKRATAVWFVLGRRESNSSDGRGSGTGDPE